MRTRLAAALLATLAFAAPAQATLGTAYKDLVCRDPSDVANTFDFSTAFVGVSDCLRLCLNAFRACERDVRDAAACQLAFASDWISFDSQVDCAGLSGADLANCKAGWALDLATWRATITQRGSGTRDAALAICNAKGGQCVTCQGQ